MRNGRTICVHRPSGKSIHVGNGQGFSFSLSLAIAYGANGVNERKILAIRSQFSSHYVPLFPRLTVALTLKHTPLFETPGTHNCGDYAPRHLECKSVESA